MSTLDALKLVAIKKPTHTPTVVIRRQKLASKVWEQIQLAKSQIEGTPNVIVLLIRSDVRRYAIELLITCFFTLPSF